MAGKPTVLTAAARKALEGATITADTVTFGDTLPAVAWKTVKELLETAGGAYVVGSSAWRFNRPAAAVVAEMLSAGQVVADRHSAGYVGTPDGLAADLVSATYAGIGDLPDGALVLEPSAGDGQIVRAITAINPNVDIRALEPDQFRFNQLSASSSGRAGLFHTTLEEYARGHERVFDAAVANPPFNITGKANIWLNHILIAYGLLRPGGRLAAIIPDSFTFRTGGQFTVLRELVNAEGSYTTLPADQFPGVGVRVGIVVIDRPFDDNRPPYLYRRRDEHAVPTSVIGPRLSWAAALHTPVQTRYDIWAGTNRVFRNVGRCITCHQPVWEFDDGENDPRGVLGDSTSNPLRAADSAMQGPTILRCYRTGCYTAAAEDKALAIAREQHWTPLPDDDRANAEESLRAAVAELLGGRP